MASRHASYGLNFLGKGGKVSSEFSWPTISYLNDQSIPQVAGARDSDKRSLINQNDNDWASKTKKLGSIAVSITRRNSSPGSERANLSTHWQKWIELAESWSDDGFGRAKIFAITLSRASPRESNHAIKTATKHGIGCYHFSLGRSYAGRVYI